MTTYQHGQQPDGAPVTWERTETRSIVQLNGMPSGLRPFLSEIDADAIARAFHVAKLVEEAESVIDGQSTLLTAYRLGTRPSEKAIDKASKRSDWLRRYREAVR